MIYLRWLLSSALDLLMMPVWYLGAPIVSLFTEAMEDTDEELERWGGWFGTYDNPPQGDEKHQREGRHPGALTGWKGYVMRVTWLWRNPGYNFQKDIGIPYDKYYSITHTGNPDISDKYKVPGSYFAKVKDKKGKLKAFEYYCVKPWSKNKCLRMRLGYKVMTDKYERYGFAPLVNTVNPFKSYGDQ